MVWGRSTSYWIRKWARGLCSCACALAVVLLPAAALAQPRPQIVLNETEERWITFADGQRLYHGREVSFLLGHLLLNSGAYRVFQGVRAQQVLDAEPLEARLPEDWVAHPASGSQGHLRVQQIAPAGVPDLIITPRIETLLFSQGLKGNRIVFGFDPERENAFNAGRVGALENEFVKPSSAETQGDQGVCSAIDFFSNRVQSTGYGPWRTDFGVNMDEGVDFRILGYGFGFRNKVYHVKSVIAFDLYSPLTGFRTTLREEVVAAGRDFMIAFAYNGFSLALELHRRKTLRNALREILPKTVARLIEALPAQLLQARDWSTVGPRSVTRLASPATTFHSTQLQLQTTSQPSVLAETAQCSKRKKGWFESTLESLFVLYALWRYDNVFDGGPADVPPGLAQPLTPSQSVGAHPMTVAVVGSGVSPRESALRGVVTASGFDFVSWDSRPWDEVGMGTAAALRLRQESRGPLQIVPIKVIGAFNQIHSGELYSAFEHLARRSDIRLVVVPFKPSVQSLAFTRGIELVAASGKTVIVPAGVGLGQTLGVVEAPAARKGYRVRGLSSKVQLAADGVGVIEEAVRWMDRNR